MPNSKDDEIVKWPYARSELFAAPDAATIEGHGIRRLARTLNLGRVTAFVGSGASSAYGRTSWLEMLITIQDDTLNRVLK